MQKLSKNNLVNMHNEVLELVHISDDHVVTIKLIGTLDFTSMRFFRDYLHHVLDTHHLSYLHLDCSTLTGIDHVGVGCLLYFYRLLNEQHCLLKLSHVPSQIQSILKQHPLLETCLISPHHTHFLEHVFDLLNSNSIHSHDMLPIFTAHVKALSLQE